MKPTVKDLLVLLNSDMDLNDCERLAQLMGIPSHCFDLTKYKKMARSVYDSSAYFDTKDMVMVFFPDCYDINDSGYDIYDGLVWLDGEKICTIDDIFAIIPPECLDNAGPSSVQIGG